MDTIDIKATEDKPAILFDPKSGYLLISGRSLPENANAFFDPLEKWITAYVQSPSNHTLFEFKLDYFNSASASKLVKLLIALEDLHVQKRSVQVKWYCAAEDEMMQARGEELKHIIELPFDIIAE
ncbi:MAG: hypothetical protein RIS47_335 [Bacteroidota bacterium]|jgi:hypothetical protein